jgi:hypothetical protein
VAWKGGELALRRADACSADRRGRGRVTGGSRSSDGFRVQGLGFQGLGFRVSDVERGAWDAGDAGNRGV